MKHVSDCHGANATFSHTEQVYMGNCLVDLKPIYICDYCHKFCTLVEQKSWDEDMVMIKEDSEGNTVIYPVEEGS